VSRNNLILVGLVALAVLAACTAQASDDSPSDGRADESQRSSTAAAPARAIELGAPVATREASVGRYGLQVELYALRRTGRTLQANWRLSVVTAQADDRFQVAGLFSDGDGRAADFSGDAADGVALIDATRSRAHLAASDGRGRCVCSRDLGTAVVPVGGAMVLGATYAAPADGVTAMDVVMPKFGTFPVSLFSDLRERVAPRRPAEDAVADERGRPDCRRRQGRRRHRRQPGGRAPRRTR
jgi:hypothetical protein